MDAAAFIRYCEELGGGGKSLPLRRLYNTTNTMNARQFILDAESKYGKQLVPLRRAYNSFLLTGGSLRMRLTTRERLARRLQQAAEEKFLEDAVANNRKFLQYTVNTLITDGLLTTYWTDKKLKLDINFEDINKQYAHYNNRTLLFIMSNAGEETAVKILLNLQTTVFDNQDSLDVNISDDLGQTPLLVAVWAARLGVVNQLLTFEGINVNAIDNYGSTPLLVALQKGEKGKEIAKTLLTNDAKADVADNDGMTPLIWAAAIEIYDGTIGDIEIVELLLRQDLDVNAARTADNVTALFFASHHNNLQIVKALLQKKGIDVNAAPTKGEEIKGVTPLLTAARRGYVKIVKALLDENAKFGLNDQSWLGLTHADILQRVKTILPEEAKVSRTSAPMKESEKAKKQRKNAKRKAAKKRKKQKEKQAGAEAEAEAEAAPEAAPEAEAKQQVDTQPPLVPSSLAAHSPGGDAAGGDGGGAPTHSPATGSPARSPVVARAARNSAKSQRRLRDESQAREPGNLLHLDFTDSDSASAEESKRAAGSVVAQGAEGSVVTTAWRDARDKNNLKPPHAIFETGLRPGHEYTDIYEQMFLATFWELLSTTCTWTETGYGKFKPSKNLQQSKDIAECIEMVFGALYLSLEAHIGDLDIEKLLYSKSNQPKEKDIEDWVGGPDGPAGPDQLMLHAKLLEVIRPFSTFIQNMNNYRSVDTTSIGKAWDRWNVRYKAYKRLLRGGLIDEGSKLATVGDFVLDLLVVTNPGVPITNKDHIAIAGECWKRLQEARDAAYEDNTLGKTFEDAFRNPDDDEDADDSVDAGAKGDSVDADAASAAGGAGAAGASCSIKHLYNTSLRPMWKSLFGLVRSESDSPFTVVRKEEQQRKIFKNLLALSKEALTGI